ncbi:ribonuclease P protein component [Pseudolysinimonas kribbensis]|uniref:ribonuclease P protein component n=1 Tax=Pseudolysinimonas kribbensis TaxID=433641 RepID=UPI003CD0B6F7
MTTADEFRAAVRRGRRHATPEVVYYRLARDGQPLRFGFIVSRAVGGAVERNRLRRRMRAVGRELVDAGRAGEDVVVRALPGSAQLSWSELSGRMRAELAR